MAPPLSNGSVAREDNTAYQTPKEHHFGGVRPPVRIVEALHDFSALHDGAHDGVILHREVPSSVIRDLAASLPDTRQEARWACAPHQAAGRIAEFLRAIGLADGPTVQWLVYDVEALATQFATTLRTDRVQFRIETVHDDGCRKFHRDAIKARLICTYSGPGTEYGASPAGQTPDRIDRVPTGCPILLKGKAWPTPSHTPVIHRSPPIEGTGTVRMVVVVDEAPVR